jgi:hypothetical protein
MLKRNRVECPAGLQQIKMAAYANWSLLRTSLAINHSLTPVGSWAGFAVAHLLLLVGGNAN